jgi:hypothetical protein
VPFPAALGRNVLTGALDLSGTLGSWPVWLLLGTTCGVVPLLVDYVLGWHTYRAVTALLLTPLLLAAVSRDWQGRGLGALASAFLTHNLLVILLAASDPARLDAVCLNGRDYWEESERWIRTGVSPKYDPDWWLRAHLQLLAAMILLTYTSFGLLPLWQGLYEVDLMNFYVGQLLVHGSHPGWAVLMGWHPWSVCRGMGYLLLTYEVTSLSLARLSGVSLSTPRRRALRWSIGILFLLLDGILKWSCLEPVRQILAAQLD